MKQILAAALIGAGIGLFARREELVEVPSMQPASAFIACAENRDDLISRLKRLEVPSLPEYNRLLPVLYGASKRHGLVLEHLAVICLAESQGASSTRFEPAFLRRYIEPAFKDGQNKFTKVYSLVKKKDRSLTMQRFKKWLASSAGPLQVMYSVAIEHGFRGSLAELAQPVNNAECAARYLKSKDMTEDSSLETVLRVYNTGSAKGIPKKGYLDRAREYCIYLGVPYEK